MVCPFVGDRRYSWRDNSSATAAGIDRVIEMVDIEENGSLQSMLMLRSVVVAVAFDSQEPRAFVGFSVPQGVNEGVQGAPFGAPITA